MYGSSKNVRSSSVSSTLRAAAMVRSALCVYERNLVFTNHLLEVFRLGSPNNWSSDLLRTPGKRDLGHLDSLLIGEFIDARGWRSANSFGGVTV